MAIGEWPIKRGLTHEGRHQNLASVVATSVSPSSTIGKGEWDKYASAHTPLWHEASALSLLPATPSHSIPDRTLRGASRQASHPTAGRGDQRNGRSHGESCHKGPHGDTTLGGHGSGTSSDCLSRRSGSSCARPTRIRDTDRRKGAKVSMGTDDHGRDVFSTIGPRVHEQRGVRVPPAALRCGWHSETRGSTTPRDRFNTTRSRGVITPARDTETVCRLLCSSRNLEDSRSNILTCRL